MLDALLDLALGGTCLGCDRPGRLLCAACAAALPATGTRVPVPGRPGGAPVWTAGSYAPPLRPLLLAHKERRAWSLTGLLGGVLAGVVASAALPEPGVRLLLVPVPSRPAVVRRRGHDPVARMTAAAARALTRAGVPARAVPLLRQRERVADQAGLGIEERAANLAGRLQVRPGRHRALARDREPVRLVVCDDVVTTGATAAEAQRALEAVGLRVTAVAALAATPRRFAPARPGAT